MDVRLVEQMVINSPIGMDGWRMFRIEYGGHAENCLVEGMIWLPQNANAGRVERHLREYFRSMKELGEMEVR